MLKKGVIMDVVTPEQARVAEGAGAIAVMALERVPADIRREAKVARMSGPDLIENIMKAVSIPVMAKCRIGHFAEAQVLEVLGVDYIDESEVLTPADEDHHIYKHPFKVPFVCGATCWARPCGALARGPPSSAPRERPGRVTSLKLCGIFAKSLGKSRGFNPWMKANLCTSPKGWGPL